MLASVARRLSRQRGWGAHLVALEWRQSALLSGELGGLRQAGLSTAAADGGGSGGGTKGTRRGGNRGKGGPRGGPLGAGNAEETQLVGGRPHPPNPQQLEWLLGRFKVRRQSTVFAC